MFSKKYIKSIIAAEISSLSRYANKVYYHNPADFHSSDLYEYTVCREKVILKEISELPDISSEKERTSIILLDGTLNYHSDIEDVLKGLKEKISRTTRLMIVCYNPYLRWIYLLANFLGIRKGTPPCTFLKMTDLYDLAELTGYKIVLDKNSAFFPFHILGIGNIINSLVVATPLLRHLAFVSVITLRPLKRDKELPSLSIVIPARNEKGNIENAILKMPSFEGAKTEIIFVEGHSNDNTWGEIQRVIEKYKGKYDIQGFQQTGKGKVDAVRLGFSKATNELLTILDADLTMPPEMLSRYYQAYTSGVADFINGSRLLYQMEGEAMRFLNKLGNIFFAKTLSIILGVRLSDSLCGTKFLSAHDYKRMVEWRRDFGDFDPFGDFELLFPAAILGLGIANIPIKYLSRTYGETNISRFYHGFVLLKMVTVGFFKVKLGKTTLPQLQKT
ncbi:MAG: hypothetical protein A2X86_18555 [Bdellovibrionales bacterium GWA2_49_15]|nr:MAG: hypothetical protein A2X86_18555 [Bdellovibrionales bacterium GWA2_49_15]HAZ11727.1 glycosyl transferase [Bdellovibrionales bacterium]